MCAGLWVCAISFDILFSASFHVRERQKNNRKTCRSRSAKKERKKSQQRKIPAS